MKEHGKRLDSETDVYMYLKMTCSGKGARAPSHQDSVMQALAFAEGVLKYRLKGIEQSRRCRG